MDIKKSNIILINELPKKIIEVEPNTELKIINIHTKSIQEIEPVKITLRENARCELYNLIVLGERDDFSASYVITHHGRKNFSRFCMQAVLFDDARLALKPLVHIIKGSEGADTAVTLSTLLIGNAARDTSEPYLEIDENSVRARHAATIGRIGKNELFYLQSRGLDKKEAEKIMIIGFINGFMQHVSAPDKSNIYPLLKPYGLELYDTDTV